MGKDKKVSGSQDIISSISLSKKGAGPASGSEIVSPISASKSSISKTSGPAKPSGYEFGKSGKYSV
jgi:hypothetical protein